jgi:acid stress chaperone HdeB
MFQVADPQQIAIWISGYFHGKTGSTVLDVQALKANSEKVKDYCRGNLQMPVMQAVENVFGLKR